MPSGMSVRAHNVAEQCMRYAVDVLSWKQSDAFPLALTEESAGFCNSSRNVVTTCSPVMQGYG